MHFERSYGKIASVGYAAICLTKQFKEDTSMPGKITKKQEEILNYIKEQILKKGYPPSVRDICTAVDLRSTSSVHSHLETLEENGYYS